MSENNKPEVYSAYMSESSVMNTEREVEKSNQTLEVEGHEAEVKEDSNESFRNQ